MKFIILGLFGLTISVASASHATICNDVASHMLDYTQYTFVNGCYLRNEQNVPIEFWGFLNPEIGNIDGHTYDDNIWSILHGERLDTLFSVAGTVKYNHTLGRSYYKYPVAGSRVGPVIANWIAHPNDENIPHVLNRLTVRNKKGCVVYSVDYTKLEVALPPLVGNCANFP